MISQSGGLLIGFVNRAAARRVPLHCVVSSGNEAVTGVEDFLDAMLADPDIKVVALICEGFRDLARIKAAGRRAADAGKRIALLKLGQSARGRAAVRAHTGSEAGDPAEIAQALRDAGIAQFNRTDELVEFCRLAGIYPRAPGRKIAPPWCQAAPRHWFATSPSATASRCRLVGADAGRRCGNCCRTTPPSPIRWTSPAARCCTTRSGRARDPAPHR